MAQKKKKIVKKPKATPYLTDEEREAKIAKGESIEGEETEEVEEEEETEAVWLETEVEAKGYVEENYELPEGTELMYATQDGNVFYPENKSHAEKHAAEKQIKLFEITWR